MDSSQRLGKIDIEECSPGDSVVSQLVYHDEEEIPRQATWLTVSKLQIGDMIGVGVLAMGSAFAQLGWVLGIIFCLGFLPLNIYLSLLMWEARNVHPRATSLVLMSKATIGNKVFTTVTLVSLYLLILLIEASYIIQLALSLADIFHNAVDICSYWWSIICCLLLAVPMMTIRTLNGARWFLWVNCLCILVTVLISVGYILGQLAKYGPSPKNTGSDVVPAMTWRSFFGGFSQIAFAYNGMVIYLEMMAEMKRPEDWPKTFTVSGPFQLILYLLVGISAYVYLGAAANGDSLLAYLPVGSAISIVANVLLFSYLCVAYLIKGNIMTRVFHQAMFPQTLNARTSVSYAHHALSAFIVITITYLIANGVPIFTDLIAITGSLLVPITGFIMPVTFVWYSRRQTGIATSRIEGCAFIVILVVFTVLTFVGTAANVVNIIESYKAQKPFSC
mmetsp:Transcript_7429/g.11952  ORF Transcript_7429/g.11952 Transcript_7429/m.11952 type:complete len:447 (+) Transcript_7429:608-1948(+)|eukprot:CAMPEP_0203767110 /NCGR_PEP_ID=MMETSP0099_2-20121227/806_1 /ASSEMBLY_ACC=CAM_ASM_000209 /TAXON_ID=96639 /ORGANISM=" , Strain NY0313808BC1" /LENGTH=446 /DNA_ID=CAMNT_0050663565 /DNA_START=564 /DNA_END=1904 /DNA_ORIENTATION=-